MTGVDLKEANRIFWMVKGSLIPESWSDEAITQSYDSYFKRLWCNQSSELLMSGFEEAWEESNK